MEEKEKEGEPLGVQYVDFSESEEEDFGYELVVIHPSFDEREREGEQKGERRGARILELGRGGERSQGPIEDLESEDRKSQLSCWMIWKYFALLLVIVSVPIGISISMPASSILEYIDSSTVTPLGNSSFPGLPSNPPSFSPCTSQIYCFGELLHTIQTARLFKDSKTFVDMPMRYPPEEVLRKFDLLFYGSKGGNSTGKERERKQELTKEELAHFVLSNFLSAGIEVEITEPTDWMDNPPILAEKTPSSPSPSPSSLDQKKEKEMKKTGDEGHDGSLPLPSPEARKWARSLHERWRLLLRKFNHEISCKSCFSSIPLPNPFVVPGGRFRGPYYWDTYWIVKGLLVSGMKETVKGILLNFGYLIKNYGFVPNGSRLYFINRSQPPLLAKMCDIYVSRTGDYGFLKEMVPLLDREYEFWTLHRSVYVEDSKGEHHLMNIYNVTSDVPRPESYLEDLKLAEGHPEEKKRQIFAQMATGAESGWDYSTRWLEGESLETIKVNQIVPVDLNAIMYDMEKKLSKFHQILGNSERGRYYQLQGEKRKVGMDELFWNETEAHWKDHNLMRHEHTPDFYISAVTPLWLEAHRRSPPELAQFVSFLKRQFVFRCGIPTSNALSDQQWDYPNAWAPMQHAAIEGLEKIQHIIPQAKTLAEKLALQWLDCNFCGWNSTGGPRGGDMFEKYDVTRKGAPGGAGEYEVQVGFGWSNGVALDLLDKYGKLFVPSPCPSEE